jgi:ATP-binding cassette, subfamily C (CFTR/MRP), member 1
LILPEDHKIGEIGFALVKQFISLSGGRVKFEGVIFISMLLYLAAKTFASIWIKMWCNNPSEDQSEVYIFIALQALSIVFLFLAAYSIIFGGARQSTTVHKEIIKHLLSASLGNFYNRVPTGRIINRLTKDLRELDEVLMYCLLYFLTNTFDLLGAFAICVYATSPFILIPIIVLAYLANLLRRYFMKTQREVTRFQQSTNSPIVSGLLSTVSGLATIRAFNKQSQFSEWQYGYFDVNKRVRLTKNGIKNWFANTLAFLCFLVSMPCVAYCLFS